MRNLIERLFSMRSLLAVLICLATAACCKSTAAQRARSTAPTAGPGAVSVQQLTHGPKHHYFGYIGQVRTIPWNASERYILGLQVGFQDRMPTARDAAEIILLDTQDDYSIRVVDRSLGWNPQQGTMMYWNPLAPKTQFFFNDRDPATNKVFCVLFDISAGDGGRRVAEYRFDDTPIGNGGVAQDGSYFAGINYARMARLRPVTGYPEAFDWNPDTQHPTDDGVFLVDPRTKTKRLLVSFAQLAARIRGDFPHIDETPLFINHTLWNRDSDRLFFFVRGSFGNRAKRINVPFTINVDGSGLTRQTHIGGHPEWAEGHRMIGILDDRQVIYDTDAGRVVKQLGDPGTFPNPEGDIALSPDGTWLVNGHREDGHNHYTFFRRSDGRTLRSRSFDLNGYVKGELRLDAAPCWNRSGNQVLIPAIADDQSRTRQMFLLTIHP